MIPSLRGNVSSLSLQCYNNLLLLCTSTRSLVCSSWAKRCHKHSRYEYCFRFVTSTSNERDPQLPNDNNNKIDDNSGTSAKSQYPAAGFPLQTPAGLLFKKDSIVTRTRRQKACELEHLLPKDCDNLTEVVQPTTNSEFFIPQVKLHDGDGSERKRVLV